MDISLSKLQEIVKDNLVTEQQQQPYSTRNSTQYSVMTCMGKESEKE